MEPFREVFISNLSVDISKVAISGVVLSVRENGFLLDDGTGQVFVSMEGFNLSEGSYIRVFGQLVGGVEVNALFIQDLSFINKEAHRSLLKELQ